MVVKLPKRETVRLTWRLLGIADVGSFERNDPPNGGTQAQHIHWRSMTSSALTGCLTRRNGWQNCGFPASTGPGDTVSLVFTV